ncbi:phage baseplate assembly protein V [Sediminimonas qiaohouensis]|uniref:phage baseplate assembly protein V n=1 Tax=Sediminimonas qiaohouensis TaxID=552061 RepID=UPI000417620F|nr:phage baseplate assembly protein V [Sediminimonas qiaohouensis]
MAIPPDDLPGIIAHLSREVGELKRRERGRSRTGKIVDVDEASGLYRVRLREESADGPAFDSPWLPVEALASGALKIQGEPVMGQTVTINSPSGELTDGVIALSSFNDSDPRPHNKGGELKVSVGDTSILATGGNLTLSSNGSGIVIDGSGVAISGAGVTHNGTDIGDTHTHTDTAGTGAGTTSPPN